MCNALDGECELAGTYDNKFHNNPDLHQQIYGELIDFFIESNAITQRNNANYGFDMGTLRHGMADRLIALCHEELDHG